MVQGFYRQIIDVLRKHDCHFKRQGSGDHELWFSPITSTTLTVDRGCMSRHVANKIMKDAGIKHKF